MDFKIYEHDTLFSDGDPTGMTGSANLGLARSFYNSRYGDHVSQSSFTNNAGAVQLYENDSVTRYTMPKEEYNSISHPIYEAGNYTTFGHVERKLMRDVLDDLMEPDHDVKDIKKPSHPKYYSPDSSEKIRELEILKNLTQNAQKYRKYLEDKNLILKMWSERRPCEGTWRLGGDCNTFMNNICPEGSKYGYIGKDDKGVEEASEKLRRDYLNRFGH